MQKNLKKVIAILLTTVVFTACTDNTDKTESQTEITITKYSETDITSEDSIEETSMLSSISTDESDDINNTEVFVDEVYGSDKAVVAYSSGNEKRSYADNSVTTTTSKATTTTAPATTTSKATTTTAPATTTSKATTTTAPATTTSKATTTTAPATTTSKVTTTTAPATTTSKATTTTAPATTTSKVTTTTAPATTTSKVTTTTAPATTTSKVTTTTAPATTTSKATTTTAPVVTTTKTTTTTPVISDPNDYVSEVIRLVNEIRAEYGLSTFTTTNSLANAAYLRATELDEKFSHTRPDGTSCFTALTEYGVTYKTAGENIAIGYKTPQLVVDGWMNSTGHRENILNSSFTQIGVGYDSSSNGWVQLFIG